MLALRGLAECLFERLHVAVEDAVQADLLFSFLELVKEFLVLEEGKLAPPLAEVEVSPGVCLDGF